MKIGLVGYYDFGNYGDELFRDIFKKNFSDCTFIIFHDAENNKLLNDFYSLIEQVDCIIIGGGDLLIPWYRSWLYWDEAFLRKPVYIYGIGVPTWDKPKQDVLAWYNYFMNHTNVRSICCRDVESIEWIKHNLVIDANKLSYYPDMVLSERRQYPLEKSGKIGLILRWQPSYAKENIYSLIDEILRLNYSVKFIILGINNTLKDDLTLTEEFRLTNIELVTKNTVEKLTSELASCDYIISQKFHGCVMAYIHRIPFIALSTADKFISFCKEINAEEYMLG